MRRDPELVSNVQIDMKRSTHPRVTKVEDVEPDEGGRSPSGAAVGSPVLLEASGEGSNDHQAERHAKTSNDEKRPATKAVDDEQGRESGDEHADADDTRSKKRNGGTSKAANLVRTGLVKLVNDLQ
jgi:hypothetical protein